jgi:hypothetical protein
MTEYRLDLLGLSETRWRGSGEFITSTGELLIYSVVGLILNNVTRKFLVEWKTV